MRRAAGASVASVRQRTENAAGAIAYSWAAARPFRTLLLRYTQALISQTCQTAACNRHHSVEQQLSRWLLWTLDRLPPREMTMTQELVANLLGVRRESITEAADRLQQDGLIRSRRGHIDVLDRSGLQSRACECYAAMRTEMNRLMPHLAAA